jgi:hypothetical protein
LRFILRMKINVIDTASKNKKKKPSIFKILLSRSSLAIQFDALLSHCQLDAARHIASQSVTNVVVGCVRFSECDWL